MTVNVTGISLASVELQDTGFMQEVSLVRHTVCLLSDKTSHRQCVFSVYSQDAWSIGSGIGPTAKAPSA